MAVGAAGALYPLRTNANAGLPPLPADADEQAEEEGGEHPAEEARLARPARDPGAPTQAMRDAHSATHLPFRSWCAECVQGRRDAPPHHRTKRGAGEVPEVAFDYAYIRRDDEDETATLLVMRDRDSKALRAWVLERKGIDLASTVDRAVAGVRELGYRGRVLIRCDGEPALVALRNAITAALPDGATPLATPVGESASNGGIEGAVKILKGLLRVHLAALERRIGGRFPASHPVMTWLVEYAGVLLTRHKVRPDGRTGYEAVRGKRASLPMCGFGEKVLFLPAKSVANRRFEYGIYLGVLQSSNELLVATDAGVVKVRTIKRLPDDRRWDAEAVLAIKGTPWAPVDGATTAPVPVAVHFPVYEGNLPPAVDRDPAVEVRAMRLQKADFEAHGFSDGCRGCVALRRSAHGIPHTAACRARMKAAMEATPEGADRVRRDAERIDAHVARAAERESEQSSKRQRLAPEGGTAEEVKIPNPIETGGFPRETPQADSQMLAAPLVQADMTSAQMLDAPAAPRAPAQTRPRSAEDDDGPDGQKRPRAVVDTMSRPDDPGASSSTSRSSPPIVLDTPTIPSRTRVPTMPTRAERAALRPTAGDVDMAMLAARVGTQVPPGELAVPRPAAARVGTQVPPGELAAPRDPVGTQVPSGELAARDPVGTQVPSGELAAPPHTGGTSPSWRTQTKMSLRRTTARSTSSRRRRRTATPRCRRSSTAAPLSMCSRPASSRACG